MNIYEKSGYLDIPAIVNLRIPFTFIVGGRATGKTYGALKYVLTSHRKFILMRRTQAQTDLINKPEFSPFKPVCEDMGIEITTAPLTKYNSKFVLDDEVIGYTAALSTISNSRGWDASDVDLLIYDEFIPEKHERSLKFEGTAFLNAAETIGRNRELKGKKPLQVLCLANAFDIANPIFMELGLVGIAERMQQKGQETYINRERGIMIIMPKSQRIKNKKSETALYKLTEGSNYADMALSNKFVYNPTDNIKTQPLGEYRPVVAVGEITIYKHKSGRRYYVSEHKTGNPESYNTDEVDIKRFIAAHGRRLYRAHMNGRVLFENMTCKSLLELYLV